MSQPSENESNSNEVATGRRSVRTQWQRRSLADPRAAAFYAGRMINAFRFHLFQALVLSPGYDFAPAGYARARRQFRRAIKVLDMLFSGLEFVSAQPRDAKLEMAELRGFLLQNFDSEEHRNAMEHLTSCWDNPPAAYSYIDRDRCGIKWGPIDGEKSFDDLERILLQAMPASSPGFFRLGVSVDEGVRPPSVFHRLNELPRRRRRGRMYRRVSARAGDLVPDPGWSCTVASHLTRSLQGIVRGDASLEAMFPPRVPGREIERLAQMDALDAEIHAWLERDRTSIDVCLDPPQVTYRGTCYQFKNPDYAIYVKAVRDEGGHWISEEAIGIKYPCFPPTKAWRIHKKLPSELMAIIECKKGKGSRLILA